MKRTTRDYTTAIRDWSIRWIVQWPRIAKSLSLYADSDDLVFPFEDLAGDSAMCCNEIVIKLLRRLPALGTNANVRWSGKMRFLLTRCDLYGNNLLSLVLQFVTLSPDSRIAIVR